MTLQQLRLWVQEGEGAETEFKRKAKHPEKIMKEVVAFANSHGGRLLIGVSDDGTIPGLKFVRDEQYVLDRAIAKYCWPTIKYELQIIPVTADRAVLCYQIFESPQKPHYVLEDFANNRGTAYVRIEDRSVQASREVRQILKRSRFRRNTFFQFGEKERLLMQHLEQYGHITLQQFKQLARLNRDRASRTLVTLVLANVLTIVPQDNKEDLFRLAPPTNRPETAPFLLTTKGLPQTFTHFPKGAVLLQNFLLYSWAYHRHRQPLRRKRPAP